ncbi:hypothetical protein ACFYUL_12570 [Streptomyces sp. NPDC004311]|uniref:hypothetical protein n=1 Tax=Streptomyces sp. NPDC004311 TaxID=3364698 RepID=UPI0036C321FB
MSDRPSPTDVDEALDRLLHEHAQGLRAAVGTSLHTEAGLVSLWPLRFSTSPDHRVDPRSALPEQVGPADSLELYDDQLSEPASPVRDWPFDPNLAVRKLVKDLHDEAVLTARVTRRLGEMSNPERRAVGRSRHAQMLNSLRFYSMNLQRTAEAFEQRAELNRAQVLELFEEHQRKLDQIRQELRAEADKRDSEAADRREPSRRTKWHQLLLHMEDRCESLVRIRADITWIFDTSDDLMGVRS